MTGQRSDLARALLFLSAMAHLTARACAAILLVAGLFVPSAAAASGEQAVEFEGFASGWRSEPLQLSDPSRLDLVGLRVPMNGTAVLGGAGAEWDFRPHGLVLHMGILRWRHALGGGGDQPAVANETTYSVSPRSLDVLEVGLPLPLLAGIGFQSGGDDSRFELGLSWGWAWAWGSARVTDSASNTEQQLSATASSPFVRADLRACTRVAHDHWGCLTLTPDLYEFGWLPGASVGAMVDL
jgi:hypothetical protein